MRKVFNISWVEPNFTIDLECASDDDFDFADRNAASIFVRELKEIEYRTPKFSSTVLGIRAIYACRLLAIANRCECFGMPLAAASQCNGPTRDVVAS
jgi:hypothetical protein